MSYRSRTSNRPSTTGPASFIAVDPDGNPILVDQHVIAWRRIARLGNIS